MYKLLIQGKSKYKHILKNELLWQELLFHAKKLRINYIQTHNLKYDNNDVFYNFVKFECTSTYPRLIFLIKFLPILKGVAIIQVYSQNKLSRSNEDNSVMMQKHYKEYDIMYGTEIRNSTTIDFRYTEPKKLKDIDNFFINFFMSINDSTIFCDSGMDLRYINNELITKIDDVISNNKNLSFDALISKINAKLYDSYLNSCNYEKINVDAFCDMTDNSVSSSRIETKEKNTLAANFIINKDFILKEIFKQEKVKIENDKEKDKEDNTLMLSKLSDDNLGYYDVSMAFSRVSNISKIENNNNNANQISFNATALNMTVSNGDFVLAGEERNSINLQQSITKDNKVTEKHQRHNSLYKLQQSINKYNRNRSMSNFDLRAKRNESGSPSRRGMASSQSKPPKYLKVEKLNKTGNEVRRRSMAVGDEMRFLKNKNSPLKNMACPLYTDGELKEMPIVIGGRNHDLTLRLIFRDEKTDFKY
jgi:hypothetical protein